MEFTELVDYPIPAGVLTEWLPCAAEDAWRRDPRPASYIHEAHLRHTSDTRFGGGRSSWLGTAFDIDGPIDTDAFTRALRRWIDRHEPLRSQAALPPGDGADASTRRTAPAGAVSVRYFRHDPADPAMLRSHLLGLFDDYTSPHSWPSYVFATREDAADREATTGSFTVFFGADHSIIDGYSVVLVAHEISALYEEERTGRPAELFPVGSYIDFGAAERADSAALTVDDDAVTIWRRTLRDNGGAAPQFPLPIGHRPARATPQRRLAERWFDDEQATRFSELCRDADAGFFAGVLACMGHTSADLTGADRFRTVSPSHTRTGPMWAGALGWFVGLRPVDLDVSGTPGFGVLAARAAHELHRTRASAQVPFDRVGELLGVRIRPRFVVSYMDVRFVPMAAQWPECNARALRSRSFTHDVYIWVNRTPEGLNVSARFPDNTVAAQTVPRFLGRTRELMAAVIESGPWPSGTDGPAVPATGR
ncbi:MAG: hypothetical protein GXY65_16465 [Rhodococcus sp.]|uniref:condensation domain-containing protein n=1 Tax=Rhodococcus TaxID=1827 RepID=UPI0016B1561A|nr:condensation domain-containing protein [Rhodococcus sp. (in: high G+C Gram-positive bacteria)]NLV80898.1 hypothetical protein [Rhodococcus sp. (in: high G+C Gram-positive bacteria)]